MCAKNIESLHTSDFSIGHHGACLQFFEHTPRRYNAAWALVLSSVMSLSPNTLRLSDAIPSAISAPL